MKTAAPRRSSRNVQSSPTMAANPLQLSGTTSSNESGEERLLPGKFNIGKLQSMADSPTLAWRSPPSWRSPDSADWRPRGFKALPVGHAPPDPLPVDDPLLDDSENDAPPSEEDAWSSYLAARSSAVSFALLSAAAEFF